MKISVVTVSKDSEATVAFTVESFLKQTHPDKEMLLIDGASRDRTLDIVRSFASPNIRVMSEPDKGVYDAMNKGLAHYTGDAVGFLNSDDAFHDAAALARIAEGLADTDAAYGDLVMVENHESRRVVRSWRAGDYAPGAFRHGWMPPHPTFYIRRELAGVVGPFDLRYKISADYDYMLRAVELRQPRVRYIDHALIDFQVGGRSTSGAMAVLKGNLECLHSRREHLGVRGMDLAFITKPLRKIAQLRLG